MTQRKQDRPAMAIGTNSRPEVLLTDVGLWVDTRQMKTDQLQRAWALAYARTLWPTIDEESGLKIAVWIYAGRAGA